MSHKSATNDSIQEDLLKHRQDDELLSIAAIYPKEVKDLRTEKAWNTWKPLELLITVSDKDSERDGMILSRVDLYVRCSVNYPNAVPFIDIKNVKGLSDQDAGQLKQEILAYAKGRIGHEILLDIIQQTETFLFDHRKPHYSSCYEEMVHNRKQQQKQIAERRIKEEEAEKLVERETILAIEQEKNRKLEALKMAHKKSKSQYDTGSPQKNGKDPNESSRSRSVSEFSCQDVCVGTTKTILKFSSGKKDLSVFCGQCISHSKRGCIVYSGMEMTSGDLVSVAKWTFQWTSSQKWKTEDSEAFKNEEASLLKQLSNLEQEFRTLKHFEHKNLVLYLGLHCVRRKDKIDIFVLQEYVSGCSLAQMARGTCLSIPQLQLYTRDILHALQYLHKNSVVHKNIRETSIFICRTGEVKLSDFSLDKKIYDIYRSFTKEPEVDFYPPTIGKGGKKGDIYRLGIILLSLGTGYLTKDVPPVIPKSLNPSFQDFLQKCLLHDEQERWSAELLLTHPFVVFSSLQYSVPKACEFKPIVNDDDFSEGQTLKNTGGSRVSNEFKELEELGKGGFGKVMKVQNKLDSRLYALKQIALNPADKLDKKIKREVKLLSRLNHENIVRYYNSWIEEVTIESDDVLDNKSNKQSSRFQTSEDLEPSTSSMVEWDMRNNNDKDDGFSTDDDEDDYDLPFAFHQDSDFSSTIVFQANDEDDKIVHSKEGDHNRINESSIKSKPKVKRYMYIQMEFCEKSTLRTAIDNCLYKDIPLLWRLFREIVEGLHYIHQQCVIHRDLKPVNIFLDSQDHVKIGDFGLATADISKQACLDKSMPANTTFTEPLNQSYYDAPEDGFRTGNIGTAMYVAPEVLSPNAKLRYSTKVDIYSLGIIFFEMCYPPTQTAMEKDVLIKNLRNPEIVLPPDAKDHLSSEMIEILKWLLQHDYNLRPSSADLIASEYIPPMLMEETDMNNIIRNTISNPKSRMYKNMIEKLFEQDIPAEFDFTYDMDGHKGQSIKNRSAQVFSSVVNTLNMVMKKHGAVNYSVPTLMPKSSIYNKDTCVHVMDRGGGVVTLPHDLRVPFARHVARSDITHLKRFTFEKVYREQQVFGCHPRQQYEYAFDIVTPTNCNSMPDAEVISVVSEIISEFPSLEEKSYMICFNHVSLLKAIILYCGIDEGTELKIYERLGSQKSRSVSKLHLQQQLLSLHIPEKTVTKVLQFLDVNDSVDKVYNLFQPLWQSKGEVRTLTKKAFKELKTVIELSEAFGVKLPMFIRPALVHEIHLFSGAVFQFVCYTKSPKKKTALDILAAGGRYDKLINSFKCKGLSEGGRIINQSSVGVSIAVERIVVSELENADFEPSSTVEFLVHAMDTEMSVEKSNLLKELWSLGFSASAFYDKQLSLDNAIDFCRNNYVPNLIIISKTEPGVIKIRTFEKERMNEKKISFSELKDNLLKLGSSVKHPSESSQTMRVEYQRSFSFSNSTPSMSVMSVRFLPQDKIHNNRRREPNIRSQVLATLQPSSNRVWEIIVVDLKMTVIGCIVSLCDINCTTDSIAKVFQAVYDLHPKYKKYLEQLAEEIDDVKSKKQNTSIILYSLLDNNFRVLL